MRPNVWKRSGIPGDEFLDKLRKIIHDMQKERRIEMFRSHQDTVQAAQALLSLWPPQQGM